MTNDLRRTLYNLAEEQGEHVRLSWGSSPPPLELTPSRCASAALVTPVDWSVLFGYPFRALDHINVLQLTALTPLVRHLANPERKGILGAVSKGRSSSRRLSFGLRRLALECLSASLAADLAASSSHCSVRVSRCRARA